MEEVAPVWVKRGVQGSEKHPESCFLTANLRDSDFQASGRWVTMGTDEVFCLPLPSSLPFKASRTVLPWTVSARGCLNLTSTNHEISHTSLFDMVCSHMGLVAATEHCRHSTNLSLPEVPPENIALERTGTRPVATSPAPGSWAPAKSRSEVPS